MCDDNWRSIGDLAVGVLRGIEPGASGSAVTRANSPGPASTVGWGSVCAASGMSDDELDSGEDRRSPSPCAMGHGPRAMKLGSGRGGEWGSAPQPEGNVVAYTAGSAGHGPTHTSRCITVAKPRPRARSPRAAAVIHLVVVEHLRALLFGDARRLSQVLVEERFEVVILGDEGTEALDVELAFGVADQPEIGAIELYHPVNDAYLANGGLWIGLTARFDRTGPWEYPNDLRALPRP